MYKSIVHSCDTYYYSLATEMGIDAIYPKMNLSKRQQQAQVMPYLLKHVDVQQPNQAWSIDITYIPLEHGFVYLTAIIDWYSRYVLSWELSNSLEISFCLAAAEAAFNACDGTAALA